MHIQSKINVILPLQVLYVFGLLQNQAILVNRNHVQQQDLHLLLMMLVMDIMEVLLQINVLLLLPMLVVQKQHKDVNK